MDRRDAGPIEPLLVVVLAISAFNGIFSPYLVLALPVTIALMPEFLPHSPGWVFFLSSVLLATATLLVSGVPAALYERLVERGTGGRGGMAVWITVAGVFTLPALGGVLGS